MTVSVGFAGNSPDFAKHERWIEAADKALYHSKENGRNRVTDFEDIKNDSKNVMTLSYFFSYV